MAQERTSHVENRLIFDRTAVRVNEMQLCLIFGRRFSRKCFPTRHLLESGALTDRRGINESRLKLEGRELARVSSSDSRKAFPRIVEGLNTAKGKRQGREKENVGERSDGFLRASARMKPVHLGFLRSTLFRRRAIVNERVRRFLKCI